jgi:TRAP-type C4-dicarboxylate transport system permease small subunit
VSFIKDEWQNITNKSLRRYILSFANICIFSFQLLSNSLSIFSVLSAARCYDTKSKLLGLSRIFVHVAMKCFIGDAGQYCVRNIEGNRHAQTSFLSKNSMLLT